MLAYMLSNGARTIIVENASRFARDLIVQETGYQALKAKGIELIAAHSPDSFVSDTPPAGAVDTARSAEASGMTLRAISAELAAAGYLSPSGKPYGPQSIKLMLRE